jgi:hypothetical protein
MFTQSVSIAVYAVEIKNCNWSSVKTEYSFIFVHKRAEIYGTKQDSPM